MEVTKSNFEELLPDIEETIRNCSFLCVDGEFTGLNNGNNVLPYDTPSQYYSKLRHGAMDFLFVQFGLAAFQYNPTTKSYSCKTYNFYVYPRALNRAAPDIRFLCQSSSVDFLASNGFDFNKLFKEGIPYLTQTDENNMKETMAERRKYIASNIATSTPRRVPPQFQEQVKSACERLAELLNPDFTEEEVRIENCGGFLRKLIFQAIRDRFPDGEIEVETKKGVLVGRKSTFKSQEERDAEAADRDLKEVDKAVGFSKVIRTIAASEKLVVGHNMLLDMCHLCHQFCDPLPLQYSEFKEMLHCLFPKVLDTKYLCSYAADLKDLIKSTVLEHLLETTDEKPFKRPTIILEEGYGYNLSEKKAHEAGYDAYITGVCFLSLLEVLQSSKEEGKPANESKVLKPFLNKLYLMRTPDTYVNLEGPDPEPDRHHVFLVTFPKDWNNNSLAQLFSAYGSVQISWVCDTKAWVALFNKDEWKKAMKGLCKGGSLPRGVTVQEYSRVQGSHPAIVMKRKSPDPPQIPAKKRRTSSGSYSRTSIEPIPEEAEENQNLGECIMQLEKQASRVNLGTNFEVSDSWE